MSLTVIPPTEWTSQTTRQFLKSLAEKVAAGEPGMRRAANELVPLLAPTVNALSLFEAVVEAVGSGRPVEQLLNDLCCEEAA